MPLRSGYRGNWSEHHKFFVLIVENFFDLEIGNWPERHLGLDTASV
jgi:hypothetical protein